ncbi:hypothetical protein [Rhodoferax fermentans]|uniref:Uncharacterized protein n=1 Tax=Rhodoferax fermentans TaxID=28066 RepID=A0A1T1ANN2_RHOFE|nr:hypothetical protein [Rhodoferax fermentans]MBK1685523.1 hypothetical protein [Rhodoferax fermentans]OOV05647.1 hypothetical protein RF819_02015 [Rhodoferax fermentans]
MSIINVWLSPERALIATDTATQIVLTGQVFDGSKLLVIPHAGVVMAQRGHNVYLSTVFSLAIQHLDISDLDTLCDAMPAMLETANKFICENLTANMTATQREQMGRQEFLLVGNSGGRVCCRHFIRESMSDAFEEFEIEDPGYVGCWDLAWGYPSEDVSTPESMADLVKIQVQKHREALPGAAIGGRLMLAEVTQAGIRLHNGIAI